jgi:hypothetical protein
MLARWFPALGRAVGVPLFYTIVFVALFSTVLIEGRLLAPGDGYRYYLPAFYGSKSLWTPYVLGGFPRFADPEMMTFYPPLVLLGGISGAWNAFVILAYVLASSFTAAFVRQLTDSRVGALLAGLVYGMSGFLVSHLGHVSIIHTAAWLPLLLLALEKLKRRFSRGWFVATALATSLCVLGGHPQIASYALLLAAVYVLVTAPGAPDRGGYWRRCLGAAAIGVGLCGMQLVPTLELARETIRSAAGFDYFSSHSLPARHLLAFVFPFLFGGAGGLYGGSYEPSPFIELACYLGLLPLGLAAIALTRGRRDKQVRFWSAAAAASLALALGPVLPFLRLVYLVPLLSLFRVPARFLLVVTLAASVLAGYGAATLARLPAPSRRRAVLTGLATMGGLFIASLAAIALFRPAFVKGPYADFVIWRDFHHMPSLWVPLALLLPGAVALVAWGLRPCRRTAALLIAAVVCELASFDLHTDWRYQSPATTVLDPPALVRSLTQTLARGERLMLGDEIDWASSSNLAMLWRQPTTDGSTSLVRTADREALARWWWPESRALDLLATRYLVYDLESSTARQLFTSVRPGQTDEVIPANDANRPLRHGIFVLDDDLGIRLGAPGCSTGRSSASISVPGVTASTIAVVSYLWGSVQIVQGTPVAELVAQTMSGEELSVSLRAGPDTGEYAWDRSDVRGMVRHRKPAVFGSSPADGGYEAHSYYSIVYLPHRAEIRRLDIRWLGVGGCAAGIHVIQLTLIDDDHAESMQRQFALPSMLVDGSRR